MQVKPGTVGADLMKAATISQTATARLAQLDIPAAAVDDLMLAVDLFYRAVALMPGSITTGCHARCNDCEHQITSIAATDLFQRKPVSNKACALADSLNCPIVNDLGLYSDDDPTAIVASFLRQAE